MQFKSNNDLKMKSQINRLNKSEIRISLILFMLISFIMVDNQFVFGNPQKIFKLDRRYYYDLKFAGIGETTYFADYYNYTLDNIPLYQTDGSIDGTREVIAKNTEGENVNIYNVIQLFENGNSLIIARIRNNQRYISLLDSKENILYDLDTIDYSTFENLYFYNFNSESTLITFAKYSSSSTKIYFLSTKDKKLIPYNSKMEYYVLHKDSDRLVIKDTTGNLSIIDSKSINKVWSMDRQFLNDYNLCLFSEGIYLSNKQVISKSLFVNYNNLKVDSIRSRKIPEYLHPLSLENCVFSTYDSTIRRTSIVVTDNDYNILDTISKDLNSYFIDNDFLFFFKISKSAMLGSYRYFLLTDLYSYSLSTRKKEMLVQNCVFDATYFYSGNKLQDGRLLVKLFTFNYGFELFVTDGTRSGTKMLKDIYSGPGNAFFLQYQTSIKHKKNDKHCFLANSRDFGMAVWQTDGTEAGTIPVLSLEPSEFALLSTDIGFYVNNGFLYIHDKNFLYSYRINQSEKVKQLYQYQIIDNIFSRETNTTTLSHFYTSSIIKDNEENFYAIGQHDCYNKFTFCYSNDSSLDTSLRDYRTSGYIIKYNHKGKRVYTKYINQYMFGDNISVSVDSSRNIYCLYKHLDQSGGNNNYAAITKYNANGDSVWNIKFNANNYIDNIIGLENDNNNNLYALFSYKGNSLFTEKLIVNSKFSPEYCLFKLSSDGQIMSYRQFEHKEFFSKINMSIINNKLIITFSYLSEMGWSSCKYRDNKNKIYSIGLDLKVESYQEFIGDDYNYITSVRKGFDNEIVLTGTFRGKLNFLGHNLISDIEGNCNLQTSYIAIIDDKLNIKYIKNLNPEKYIINSAFVTNDYNIYTVGKCDSCAIDTLIYPKFTGYPKYQSSISARKYDYWGNELESFYYSKRLSDYWNLVQPKIIEHNNEPLICDVYSGKIGYIPGLAQSSYIDFLLLFKPILLSNNNQNYNKSTRYTVFSDMYDNHFIKKNNSSVSNKLINIRIFDLRGKLIFSNSLTLVNGNQILNLPDNLAFGFYQVLIVDDEGPEFHKLINE